MIAAAVCIVAATVSIGYLHVSQTAKADEDTQQALLDNERGGPWRLAGAVTYDDVIDPRELRNAVLAALRLAANRRRQPTEPVRHTGYLP